MGTDTQVQKPSGEKFSPAPTTPSSRQLFLTQPLMGLLLISLLAAAIYSNTFSASFQFDDESNITENPWIKNLSNSLHFSGSRYMGFLSFALNYYFGQLNVFGYHLVNLLIHIANGFLVYLLVRLLFRASSTPPLTPHALRLTTAPWIALVTALLFVAHPIQTQAVTYIVQRFASLATLFYLLTVVFYLHGRLSPPKTRSRYLGYAGALIATILAMITKEITFTLPFMLLLVEAVFFGSLTRKSWIRLIPFFLTLPIIPLSRPGALGEGEAGFASDITDFTRLDYLFTQFRVIVTYLRLLVFPVHQNLDYDYPVYHSLLDPPVFLSFLFLSALFALAIYLLFSSRLTPPASRPLTSSASRLTAFGILWFFLTLSIESSIIPIRDVIFEHRLYLPSMGFFLAASVAAFGYSDRGRLWKAIGIGGIVTVLSVATYQRNKIWQDEVTLWTDVTLKSPQKARGYFGLGRGYAGQKKWEAAVQEYKTALTLKPDYAEVHNNLGVAYKKLGRLDEAIQEYITAISLNPYYGEAYNNLGVAYRELGHLNVAIQEYQTALTFNSHYDAEAHNNLGVAYADMERWDEAVQEYKTALTLKPDYAEAHNNLGVAYKKLGRLDEAIQEYKTALSIEPDMTMTHNNLGQILDKQGKIPEAFAEVQMAVQLNPDDPQLHYNLGALYRKLGKYDKAIQEYKTATILNPDYAEAYNNLGLGYYVQGRLPEALIALKEVTRIKPDYVEAHNNLGVIYKAIGQPQEAIREFQTAIKLKPDHVDAYYNLGTTYQQVGQIPEAIRAFKDALKIDPGYERARKALESLSP